MENSIIQEAQEIIHGPRAESYGPASKSFSNIAKGWSVLLGVEVTPEQVAMCMTWLKLCRESNKHQRDNLVDIIGYTALIEKMKNEQERDNTI